MSLRTYALVTLAYWVFMLTDGALRMVVLFHFHQLGYSPIQLAFLFLLYEFAGIITNLLGGWVGSKYGLRRTLFIGLTLQIIALSALACINTHWLPAVTIVSVMAIQALAGVAKDLTKMSSKSAIKLALPDHSNNDTKLFKWVALLTGSKNSLKGIGFFLGSFLLTTFGFQHALLSLSATLFVILIISLIGVKGSFGKTKIKVKITQIFSKSKAINRLSFARAFLFASRDVWFVVGLPVFLHDTLGWSFWHVGSFMACWTIGYGCIQAFAPKITNSKKKQSHSTALAHLVTSSQVWIFILCLCCSLIAIAVTANYYITSTLLIGLCVFGCVFAINSSLHSYLILAYTDEDKISLNVGFYYMANACGRLLGTLLSGTVYLIAGLSACLWTAAALTAIAACSSLRLPKALNEANK